MVGLCRRKRLSRDWTGEN